ncbi:SusC/RagA family TonB-linked outer membrane protein [Flammeovirga yaeyamensis]|uniref:SusC/RagA family TonB-linked outer membrane protein n=1 Tax=Flammeovirga yaeyamensis TaxID=367791 RepID=A0AAX1N0V3_9BACT|nr:TonB-dependent receptor [Flammeovirga yaeyamensis]MBB3698502.1 TonB-linked SusC/RagA family outer membrane protein [Flammeovirga yaeyamensis]NMF34149.1 TonB-dependent receptor [Flammeovirga yaeyamensis]QWG01134.1 SusC/RagA family TonB-linked outer membrane protein [Flammeovirga yaeyamensis]
MLNKTTLIFVFLMCCMGVTTYAQHLVKGQVTDESNMGLPGVNIKINGTSEGAITDLEGRYQIGPLNADAELIFSYIGMESQTITVGTQKEINVLLMPKASELDELVVIGYGEAKSQDLTSPITTVSSEEITSMNTSSAMSAIQGKVPGVNIVNSGVPGEGPSVRIRGVGSLGDASPLYVVDGMFLEDINFINPNDIESMSILKDASAAAIYGVRAANGVVIITTKSGSEDQKMRVTYDGYYGVQHVQQTMKMANTEQYANLLRASGDKDFEMLLTKSMEHYGSHNGNPSTDTDWYNELVNNFASIQNHGVSLNGGFENTTYSFGVNYFNQESTMNAGGFYERLSVRSKVDFKLTEKFKLGTNLMITNEFRQKDHITAWSDAFRAAPIYPVYEKDGVDNGDFPGRYANPHHLGYHSYYANPMAMSDYHSNDRTKYTRILPSFTAEYKPILDLSLRSALSMDMGFDRGRKYTPAFVHGDIQNPLSQLDKYNQWNSNYIWDNTATYSKELGNHHFSIMGGFSVREETRRKLSVGISDVPEGREEYYYITNGDLNSFRGTEEGRRDRGVSAFSRMSYNYDEKYLLSLTMRADGSSKYQDKWGYFPSIGAGWVISNEEFLKSANTPIDFLKVRASWGLLGNDKIDANRGVAAVESGGINQSAIYNGQFVPGMLNNTLFSHLGWELVEETNVGIDVKLLDYRLDVEVDYFRRDTKNMAVHNQKNFTSQTVRENTGSVRNSGIEFMVNWSDKIGKLRYSVGANATYLRNSVIDLGDQPYLFHNSPEFRQISTVGMPMYSFFGWKTDGVYQNQAEIEACDIAKANGLKPGDFRFVDTNGDGVIDDEDRQILGNYHPNWSYGFNINLNYKNWGLGVVFQGVSGVDILNMKRGEVNKNPINNIDRDLATNLWSPENPTNKYPSAEGLFNPWNTGRFTDFYIEDGSYFRIQNIRFSYDLPQQTAEKMKLQGMQIYLNADRPYTHFHTNGFTPEVGNGIDYDMHPIAAVYSLGLKVNF